MSWKQPAVVTFVLFVLGVVLPIAHGADLEVAELIERTKSSDPRIRANAACNLGKMGKHVTAAVPSLIRLLDDREKPSPRKASPNLCAYVALGQIGSPAVPALIQALEDKNPECRSCAASLLAEIGDARAVEPLIVTLRDKEERVVYDAIRALHRLADRRATEPLVALMNDKSKTDGVRSFAAPVLGAVGREHAVEALVGMLNDEQGAPLVRQHAAVGLGYTGDRGASETLLAMTTCRDTFVRQGVFWGLSRLGNHPKVVSHLMSALKNKREDAKVRRAAAIGLGRSKAPNAIKYLLVVSDDATEDMRVRQSTIAALALSEHPEGQKRVFAALGSDVLPLVYAAASAFPYIKSRDASALLIGTLKHKDPTVRRLAAQSLGERKEIRAIEPLEELLGDDGRGVAFTAAKAIAEIRGDPWNDYDSHPYPMVPDATILTDGAIYLELFGP